MADNEKSDLSHRIEGLSRYVGLVSGLVSVFTALSGNPLIAYFSLGVLGLIVGEQCVRVIFQKSPIQQAYQILLPSSVARHGEMVYRYPAKERRKAVLWLAGLAVLFIGVVGFNLWQALKPPVRPAQNDETLVLILQFQSSVSVEAKHDFAQLIFDDLIEAFRDGDIRIEQLDYGQVISSEDAQELGKRTNAALVIWGKFDENFVFPRYEVIQSRDQVSHLDLGHTPLQKENERIEFTLGTELPQSVVYLTKFTIGQVYYLDRQYEEALDAFNDAFLAIEESNILGIEPSETLDWKEEYVHFYRANTFANLGRLSWAMLDYQLAIQKDPKFAEAYNNLGVGYSLLGDSDRALEQFNLAIETGKFAVAYYNRGSIFYRRGDFQQAIQDYSQAIDIEPQIPIFYQARADGYFAKCEYWSARDDLTTAIELLTDDTESKARAFTNRGITSTRLGEYEKAIQDYEHALDLDPGFAWAYYNSAATRALMGETEAAIKELQEAFQLDQDIKTVAACDAEFDNIRSHPQLSELAKPEGGCPPVLCP